MSLVEYSLKNRTLLVVLSVLAVFGGIKSYNALGRLEDPEFTIKTAVIYTQYPGASPAEVEEEVTDPLETAVQQLKQLDKVRSISKEGLSIIYVDIKDKYNKDSLPQVWDELRRKVQSAQGDFPPGVETPIVNDDFGDVYGIFFALYGKGFSYRELKDHADLLRRELLLCDNVGKIAFSGEQTEVIYVEMSRAKIAKFGVSPSAIIAVLNQQNLVCDAGKVGIGDLHVPVRTTGLFQSVEDIGNLLIPVKDKQVYLRDLADIRRGYYDPPRTRMLFNGEEAIGLGISPVPGGNVVKMGQAVEKRLAELDEVTPVGLKRGIISYQSKTVSEAVDGFVINLVEAVIIVILLLVVFMGKREGVLIGVVLLLTILTSFIFMEYFSITLQRISLGALIIALGMLVDNAIVVADGIMVKEQRGMNHEEAGIEAVNETKWPLLGATVIAILAFAAISLSPDATGEFLGSLFTVIAISLLLSWVLAVTVTPLMCVLFLNESPETARDPHDRYFYRLYEKLLDFCLTRRWLFIVIIVMMLAVSLYSFRFISRNFFPSSPRTQFMVDAWFPEGTHIDRTTERIREIDSYVRSLPHVDETATFVGAGGMRFILTYSPEMPYPSYAQILVNVDSFENISATAALVKEYLRKEWPQANTKVSRFRLGPSAEAVEARLRGSDKKILRVLADQVKEIMQQESDAQFIRDDWREPVKTVYLELNQPNARRAGVTRPQVNNAIAMTYSGKALGIYREGDALLPIISRAVPEERKSVDDFNSILIWSDFAGKTVPLSQLVKERTIGWEDPVIQRRNRMRTITVSCDFRRGTALDLFQKLSPKIEKRLELPPGYELDWGGEYEKSRDANRKLMAKVPLAFAAMFVISVALFNSLRHPIIIFLGLPLSFIGVTAGLLVSGQPFGFMALLGVLSLSGMLIKNEIVLLEQINLETASGKDKYKAIIDAAISRVRPVCMAAFTTVLGMAPLITDAFFVAMAVTIMAGLTFATVLTLVVTPVLYATFFRIHKG
jgi:multidrug efflux pump subunit AcrB